MRRIGIILVFCMLWAINSVAASRTSGTPVSVRSGATTQHVRTQTAQKNKTVRVATPKTKTTVSRSATTPKTTSQRSVSKRNNTTSARVSVVERVTSETRTGIEYEQCKDAYFACMDQFCQLKNDEYRRCSCSDRITSLQKARNNLQEAGEQLTAFNENLDIVGKTAAQATAMNTASDGELALTKDNSASKALLTAIMNSIRGTDSHVENNKLSDLNSIDLSFDAANSFGTTDIGQTIASYNGQALYSAVYPQCRNAVKSNCNDASLQRAVNAYLMAIEQDCNTVQTAISNKQKETHATIRESSSMLDMARAENHKKHNSDDAATCLANVEAAILSEEVCGENYHKCLDNGEYIDVSTGAPIAGVVDFYKLGTLLTFNSERNNNDQKLAQNPNNRTFVTTFEKRVKQFAEPALDKCYDEADTVWQDYLNKAMLDIYYAQQSKVNEIKQGCFDFVSACYMNGSEAMTNAMQGLIAAQTTTLNPNVLQLNKSLCSDYINSCNNMFNGDIVNNYIQNRHDTDSLTACRAVVQQCFNNYGGQNYENFYYPSSGLFASGNAPDWFALYSYECDTRGNCVRQEGYKSECAKQLATIEACNDPKMIEDAFGGLDYFYNASNAYRINIFNKYAYYKTDQTSFVYTYLQNRNLRSTGIATEVYNQIIDILQTQCSNLDGKFMNVQNLALYHANYNQNAFCEAIFHQSGATDDQTSRYYQLYVPYSVGKKTTVFERVSIVSINRLGRENNSSIFLPNNLDSTKNENMCPRDYNSSVDVQSWGACLCWENGGRRSNDGTSTRCVPTFPVQSLSTYELTPVNSNEYSAQQTKTYGLNNSCGAEFVTAVDSANGNTATETTGFTLWPYSRNVEIVNDFPTERDWCTGNINKRNQVCPFGTGLDEDNECTECQTNWTTETICPDTSTTILGYYCTDGNGSRIGITTTIVCPNGITPTYISVPGAAAYGVCYDGTLYHAPDDLASCGSTYNLTSTVICHDNNAQSAREYTAPTKCPQGYTLDTTTKKCKTTLPGLSDVSQQCCPKGYTLSPLCNKVFYCCPAGYSLETGLCNTITTLPTFAPMCKKVGTTATYVSSVLSSLISSETMTENFPEGN